MALKDAAPVWDDQRFIMRCAEAAKRKGWSLTTLCQEAGIADNSLSKTPAYGRNIASIILLAKALEVPEGWLLDIPANIEDVIDLSGKFVKEFVKNVLTAKAGSNGEYLDYERLYKKIDLWLINSSHTIIMEAKTTSVDSLASDARGKDPTMKRPVRRAPKPREAMPKQRV